MTTRACRIMVALAALALCARSAEAAQDTSDYVISDYELTIELQPGSTAVRATMDLAYQIRSGTKSEGFKYIGNLEPIELTGTEIDGRPMRMSVERQRETLIRWRFTPLSGPGIKRVRVSFTIAGALTGTIDESVFRAGWAGVFKVPVRRAVYRLVLPPRWEEDGITSQPSRFTRTTYSGRDAIEVAQRPLRDSAFVVTLRPAIAAATPMAAAPVARIPAARSRSSNSVAPVVFFFLMVVVGLFVAAVLRAKRGVGRGSSVSSSSSCAGGASCSSSCGGGGCGGGCGG